MSIVDKTQILRELMKYKDFASKADFARFLNITPQGLATWFSRNTFDINKIASKFPEVNDVWLLTGKGDMLKESNEKLQAGEPTGGCGCPVNDFIKDVLENSQAVTEAMKSIVNSNAALIAQQSELIATIRALAERR